MSRFADLLAEIGIDAGLLRLPSGLIPLGTSDPEEALLFGSEQAARQERLPLIADSVEGFLHDARPGYFLTGYWGHGINSYAFYYVRVEADRRIYLRLPYGGGYMDNEDNAVGITDFFARLHELEEAMEGKNANLVIAEVMGGGSSACWFADGRHIEVHKSLFSNPSGWEALHQALADEPSPPSRPGRRETKPSLSYRRHLSDRFERLLTGGGELADLVALTQHPWRERGLYLDLELRRNDEVMLYAGLTRPLRLRRLSKGTLRLGADAWYQSKHPELPWGVSLSESDLPGLVPQIQRYVAEVQLPAAATSKEGFAQNWLARRFGPARRDDHDLVAIDREVILSYRDRSERERIWGQVREWGTSLGRELSRTNPARYGSKLDEKPFGQELDLLMWDPVRGCFLVTEVKDGSNASGIYRSPIQVAAYTAAWRTYVHFNPQAAHESLRHLIEQKQRLGLIAGRVELPSGLLPGMFVPLVVVQDPKPDSGCWSRLAEVSRLVQARESGLRRGAIISELRVLAVEADGWRSLDDEWRGWAEKQGI